MNIPRPNNLHPDQWVEQRVLSKPVKHERPEGVEGRWVSIDMYEQVLIAYENDTAVYATVISTAVPGTRSRATRPSSSVDRAGAF